ncbi:hypothetical protein [Mycobacterium sp. 1081908.1]|nr:hypothetical protein [Mycobacterium sp. 1081908.1]
MTLRFNRTRPRGAQVGVENVHQYLGNPSMTVLGKLPVTFTRERN